jgi:Holliday junction resolvase RusA-like endonuclease
MNWLVVFHVPGKPKGKARARMGHAGHWYTPKNTVNYETVIAYHARRAMAGKGIALGALQMTVDAFVEPPARWVAQKRSDALAGLLRPTSKPDFDNIAKVACDAMSGIVYRDDAQVVDCRVRKFYAKIPMLSVSVRLVHNEEGVPTDG